jgi:hypothetical protein
MNQTTSGAQPAGSAPPGKSSKDLRPDLVAIVERIQVLEERTETLLTLVEQLADDQGPPRFPKQGEVYVDAHSPGFAYRIVGANASSIGYEQLRNDDVVAREVIDADAWPRFHRQRTLRRAT